VEQLRRRDIFCLEWVLAADDGWVGSDNRRSRFELVDPKQDQVGLVRTVKRRALLSGCSVFVVSIQCLGVLGGLSSASIIKDCLGVSVAIGRSCSCILRILRIFRISRFICFLRRHARQLKLGSSRRCYARSCRV
jgi:hypothetical protein